MLITKQYDRAQAVAYAQKWAFSRNPAFYDFSNLGGDCTSFISQCVYAGSCEMNYTPTFGWYFITPSDRSPSWSGVPYFYQFMTTNRETGPYAEDAAPEAIELGDVIQLGDGTGRFYHSLLVTGFARDSFLVSAHTNDAFNRPLSSYSYRQIRFLHLLGVRYTAGNEQPCPNFLY